MPATAHYEPASLIDEIHISGIFKRADLSAFSGAGLRPTPVRFFSSEEIENARAWLTE